MSFKLAAGEDLTFITQLIFVFSIRFSINPFWSDRSPQGRIDRLLGPGLGHLEP